MAKDPGRTLQTAKLFPLRETSRTLRDSLSSTDRIDLWRLNNRSRSTLNLSLKSLKKEGKLEVSLLNERGRALATSRRGDPITLAGPLEAGTYYVRVKSRQPKVKTGYALALSAAKLGDQFGDTFEAATRLRSASSTIDESVGGKDPNDFLFFGTLWAGQFNVSVTNLTGDATLEIYDGNRNLLFASTNPGSAAEAINQRLTGIAGSNYFVRISPAVAGQALSYQLDYSFKADQLVQKPSGLRYVDLTTGSGATPRTGQTVTVQYTGILPDGTKFDSSRDRNRPFSFQIGLGRVIAGWEEGLSDMRVGGRRQLVIPAELAYGAEGAPGIPPNSPLIFDVEVLDIRDTP
jgi:hypothetical protein